MGLADIADNYDNSFALQTRLVIIELILSWQHLTTSSVHFLSDGKTGSLSI